MVSTMSLPAHVLISRQYVQVCAQWVVDQDFIKPPSWFPIHVPLRYTSQRLLTPWKSRNTFLPDFLW